MQILSWPLTKQRNVVYKSKTLLIFVASILLSALFYRWSTILNVYFEIFISLNSWCAAAFISISNIPNCWLKPGNYICRTGILELWYINVDSDKKIEKKFIRWDVLWRLKIFNKSNLNILFHLFHALIIKFTGHNNYWDGVHRSTYFILDTFISFHWISSKNRLVGAGRGNFKISKLISFN